MREKEKRRRRFFIIKNYKSVEEFMVLDGSI